MSTAGETRALSAALSAPSPFVSRTSGRAMHMANHHVDRWAPENSVTQTRAMKSLGFVDRLVTPWLETSQRSAGVRMFNQYQSAGFAERSSGDVSWVFPRPWYQDELDWMAAAREQTQVAVATGGTAAPQMLTTRGTYVAPAQRRPEPMALPSALYEYVAPSLSVARPAEMQAAQAYSSMIPFAAAQAAQVMSRALAPLAPAEAAPARMSPGLRAVLTTLLERAAAPAVQSAAPTRIASIAPELVTPPAPRADVPSEHVAEQVAEQRAKLAELMRVAQGAAQREHNSPELTRVAQAAAQREHAARPVEARADVATQARASETARQDSAAVEAASTAERKRIEDRIAQRVAERTQEAARDATRAQQAAVRGQRLHEMAREAAARDAQSAATAAAPTAPAARVEAAPERRVPVEITQAMAALPAEFAAYIGRQPERAVQAVGELADALRAVELMARNVASGGTIESARGPRVVMPAGLGGLVAAVGASAPQASGLRPQASNSHRVPQLPMLRPTAATTALGATVANAPAALGHVAWSDRWLARFAGARPQSLDLITAASNPAQRFVALAEAAPGAVFVAPQLASPAPAEAGATLRPKSEVPAAAPARPMAQRVAAVQPPGTVERFDDDAETPDDVFQSIAMGAMRARTAQPAAPARAADVSLPIDASQPTMRATYADMIAHGVPSAPGAGLFAQLASSPFAPALQHVMPLAAAPAFDVRSLFGDSLAATYLAGALAPATEEIEVAQQLPAFDWDPAYVAPEAAAPEAAAAQLPAEVAAATAALAPLMTLRSALLKWEVETSATGTQTISAPAMAEATVVRSMIDAMTLPMIAETSLVDPDAGPIAQGAPGMIASRAEAWSVAQERSSADLAYDFVPPELVLAARVYGLGPAEAAQAARLAIAGPGALTAMAGTVDRTFVQAMAAEEERKATGHRPQASGLGPQTSDLGELPAATRPDARRSAFGVEKRNPRGAFLWPQGTVAALGMTAAAPDGEQSMSVAALELLAAQSVAELGTYAALGDAPTPAELASPELAAALGKKSEARGPQPTEQDALDSALDLVPQGRRAKFEALFVALGQSAGGRIQSPAARAARALALAGRGDETISARERATIAWDVLPTVYAASGDETAGEPAGGTMSTGAAAVREHKRRAELEALVLDSRPGLGSLSSRAGEALGSYVTPTGAFEKAASGGGSREAGAMLRAPTAAQELVRTGRPAGRHGGGEVEIPSWFESAARKMLADRSPSSDGISMAELTLITAAPASHVAASTRGVPSAAPSAPPPADGGDHGTGDKQMDIERIATDVFKHIQSIMDATRARNGEPYL